MNFKNLNIGIWGAGIVGLSALNFFKKRGARLSIYDSKLVSRELQERCAQENIAWYKPEELALFLNQCDALFPSPGVNSALYKNYDRTLLHEADIFFTLYKKPIIAVTGTIGKTTVTYALQSMLHYYGYRVQIGGNIGIALLDLIDNQDDYDYAVIELSSFQLEHSRSCKPKIAVWTNLYSNHLDRHETMDNYFHAKLPLLTHQDSHDMAFVHESVKPYLNAYSLPVSINYFSSTIPEQVARLVQEYTLYQEHYTILFMVAEKLNLDLNKIALLFNHITPPEHRVTCIGTYKGISFYDDSKSTVVEATRGALQRFLDKRVILFFGGVSKGVSREHFFHTLSKNIFHICFFGKEASLLKKQCDAFFVNSSEHATLEQAFTYCTTIMKEGDVVLFSPGGASFDLFTDYKHRGKTFQILVRHLINSQ